MIWQTGWERFWICALHIVTGDGTHQMGSLAGQLKVYAGDIGRMAALFAACALGTAIVARVGGRGRAYRLLLVFLAMVLFRNVYVMRPLNRMHATILSAGNMVKAGPMMGICTDYMGAYVRNSNLYDWTRYVQDGDRILIVGLPASTIGYLYQDTEICVDSTISTPTYSEKLLDYWELNPWKEPNVVILDCWFGEPRVPADQWIMGWLEENFESYVDGTYVRVYRRD